jgi:bacterioferritin
MKQQNKEKNMELLRSSKSPIDVEEVRKSAKTSVEDGALTGDYLLDQEMACQLLNDALASEILCVLRYRQHQIAAKGIDNPQVSAEFEEHAKSEESHVLLIAERISQLGGTADFSPSGISGRSATEFGSATELVAMIHEDLVAERVAIEVYRKLIQWFGQEDPTTRRMLEEILEDEEEHANDLADLLAREDLSLH